MRYAGAVCSGIHCSENVGLLPEMPVVWNGRLPTPIQFPQRKIGFKITEALNGLNAKPEEIVIETGQGGGDCGYGFQRGYEYIVYASKRPDGSYSTGICTPTRPINLAAEDLKYFHQLANALPTSEIRVTTYNVFGPQVPGPDGRSQLPTLSGASVTIDGVGTHELSLTDAAGLHIFSNLQSGEYQVNASLEGFAKPESLRPVKVHAKGCAQVDVLLRLDRTVSGRVLSSEGLPAAGVTIESVPFRPRHDYELPWANDSAVTDANGRFQLRNLTTGDYYLGVSLARSPTLQNPFTRWFFPGTENPTTAGILHVSERPESQVFDFMLPAQQHDRTIQGTVFWPDGRPAEGVSIFLEDPRWAWQASTVAAITDKLGHFTTHGLDATRYRIQAAIFKGGSTSAEPMLIDPGPGPLNINLVLTKKGYSPGDNKSKGLDDWRKGLGLR